MDESVLKDKILDNAYYVDFKGIYIESNIQNKDIHIETGAIVLATGFKSYEPRLVSMDIKILRKLSPSQN